MKDTCIIDEGIIHQLCVVNAGFELFDVFFLPF